MVKKMLSQTTSQTTAIYDEVSMTFGPETFQEEQQKAIDMFFKGNNVSVLLPTGYREFFNISSSASD